MHATAILYPGCIEFEIMLAIELIGRAFEVRIATPDGADHRGAGGIAWRADCAYTSLDTSGAMCVLIPGGDPGSVIGSGELERFLVDADTQGIAIGAVCAGPVLLGKAGLLRPRTGRSSDRVRARRFTHGYGSEQMPFVGSFFEGGVFVDDPIVRDGNILTAQARAHAAFGVEIARMCGALDSAPHGPDREADRLHAYYRSGAPGKTTPDASSRCRTT